MNCKNKAFVPGFLLMRYQILVESYNGKDPSFEQGFNFFRKKKHQSKLKFSLKLRNST